MLLIEFLVFPILVSLLISFFYDFIRFCLGEFEKVELLDSDVDHQIIIIKERRILSWLGILIAKQYNRTQEKIKSKKFAPNFWSIIFICPYCCNFWISLIVCTILYFLGYVQSFFIFLLIVELLTFKIQQYI